MTSKSHHLHTSRTPTPKRPPLLSHLTNPTIALLSTVHDPLTAQEIHSSKIQHHPLSLLPTSVPSSIVDARAKRCVLRASTRSRRKKAQKPRPLTARQRRALGVCDVLPAGRRTGSKRGGVAAVDATAWDRYAPLRKLWAGYIREILNVGHEKRWVGVEEAGAMLVGADFHGAVITVVRSRCVGRVGVQGMVLREARGVLVLVGRRGEVRMVPKEGTVFEVRVVVEDEVDEEARNRGRDLVFEVHGDGVVCRPAERAGKKFKAKMNVNL